MSTSKARTTMVKVGSVEVEGLMLPDGSYGIAIGQIAGLIGSHKNYASQEFKRILGKDFNPHKVSTDLGKAKQNVISLVDFEKLLAKLDRAGNKNAQDFRDAMVGLSLHQLWSDAFGVKFDTEDRQAWVKFREVHKKQFHPKLTYWWKEDGCKGQDYAIRVQEFKSLMKLPSKSVNEYTEEELEILNLREVEYNFQRKLGSSHKEALDGVILVNHLDEE